MIFDDSDVKIFTENEKKDDSFDEVSAIAEMTRQRSNGNAQKAKDLGTRLAEKFVDEIQLIGNLENEVGALNYSDDIMYQIKVLLVFSAEYCINRSLPSPFLSATVINSMYETISAEAFEFYDRLDDAAEYSFYYLAVRKGGEIAENIGVSFAMLCGKEKDNEFCTLGSKLFNVATKDIEHVIDIYEFV